MRSRKWVVLLVLVVLLGGGIARAQYVPAFGVTAWDAVGTFWAASGNLYTTVKASITNPQYYDAARWVAAGLGPAAAAVVARVAIAAGAIVTPAAIAAAVGYAAYKGWQWAEGQFKAPPTTGPLYELSSAAVGTGLMRWQITSTSYYNVYLYPTATGNFWTCQDCLGYLGACSGGWDTNYYNGGWNFGVWNNIYRAGKISTGTITEYRLNLAASGHEEYVQSVGYVPISIAVLEAALGQDLAAQNQWAKDLAAAAAVAVAGPWQEGQDHGYPPAVLPNLSSSAAGEIKDALASGISEATKTEMAAADVAENALKDQVAQGNSTALTQAQVQAAIEEALKKTEVKVDVGEFAAPGDPQLPPDGEAPVKVPITGYLDTFWDGLSNLPMVQTLTGMSLVASGGSPRFSMVVGSLMGEGEHVFQFDFETGSLFGISWVTYLATLGNLLMAVTAVRWFLYIFKRE